MGDVAVGSLAQPGSLSWWDKAPEFHERSMQSAPGQTDSHCYQFADGFLEIDSDNDPLNRRFEEIYSEGAVNPRQLHGGLRVGCKVRSLPGLNLSGIAFEDPEILDPAEFCRTLFPDRNYVAGPAGPSGWETIATADRPYEPLIALKGDRALVDARQVWQPFIANYAVNRVLRLQRKVLFFHGASMEISGRGILLVGPKCAGKTTTSLTLASRGHGFLGDEIAAVRVGSRAMLPFRRAASIRAGVRAPRVSERLDDGNFPKETFPDGSARVLARVSDLFPGPVVTNARLSCVFFLSRFGATPECEKFSFGVEHFRLLTPLAACMWGVPTGLRMLEMSRMLSGVSCYHLNPGQPAATAELLESIAEGLPN